jgi:hypothetical protein
VPNPSIKWDALKRAPYVKRYIYGDNMHRVLLVVSFFIISLPTLAASSIDGIKIGDNLAAIEAQHLSMVVSNKISDGEMRKYKTKDGNDLSITIINNKVVYIEKDWSQDLKSNKTLFSGFVFGKTSLSDIRTKFGTNGFTYKSIVITKKGDNLITFNCYELNDKRPFKFLCN